MQKVNEWTDQEHDTALLTAIDDIEALLVVLKQNPDKITALAFEVAMEDGRLIGGDTAEDNILGIEAGEAQSLYDILSSAADEVVSGLLTPAVEED